ncbi:hypothetical protein AWZ03_014116 [Drosophila navojoa]|uniref:Uncharacterized protein n=1 Tax=Drosophila navojoa TaxID=7232 RepID=A0A484ATT3_DRONA|nr:hypothetical protein AWZ03_014116 [Drosophila navojoa]
MADQGNIFGNEKSAEKPQQELLQQEQSQQEQPQQEQLQQEQPQQEQEQPQQQELPKPEEPKPEQPKPEQPKPEQPKPEQPPVVTTKGVGKQAGKVADSTVTNLETEDEDMDTTTSDSSFFTPDSSEVEMDDAEPKVGLPAAGQPQQQQHQQQPQPGQLAGAVGPNPYAGSLSIYGVVPRLINIIGERNGFNGPSSYLNETFFETFAQSIPRLNPSPYTVPPTHCSPLTFPMINMTAVCNDYSAMQRLMVMTELHFEELVRLWQALQTTLQMMATVISQLPETPITDPQDPGFNQEAFNRWSIYQQQLDECVQMAEMFAQLIQCELCGMQHP